MNHVLRLCPVEPPSIGPFPLFDHNVVTNYISIRSRAGVSEHVRFATRNPGVQIKRSDIGTEALVYVCFADHRPLSRVHPPSIVGWVHGLQSIKLVRNNQRWLDLLRAAKAVREGKERRLQKGGLYCPLSRRLVKSAPL